MTAAVPTTNEKLLATQVSWRDKEGTVHTVTVGHMLEEFKRVYDEWPGGIDELEASQASLSRELRSMRRIAGKMWLRPNS